MQQLWEEGMKLALWDIWEIVVPIKWKYLSQQVFSSSDVHTASLNVNI